MGAARVKVHSCYYPVKVAKKEEEAADKPREVLKIKNPAGVTGGVL